jgi:hypothetical protein
MYEDILKRLGIEGETESDKFRSLIECLYDYVDVNPRLPVETKVRSDSGDQSRLDVLDLVIQSLREHEANLDRIATKLEKATVPISQAATSDPSRPILTGK